MRKKFICGNWKMNKTSAEALSYLVKFKKILKRNDEIEIAIAFPFTLLDMVSKKAGKLINVCAQDLFYEKEGAFTGEVSPKMVKEFADYVLIGHSERRTIFHETDEIVNKKIASALNAKLKVIMCIGETLDERNKSLFEEVTGRQLRLGLHGISEKDLKDIIIAYEPVWAIGTGKNASPHEIEEAHSFIRRIISRMYSDKSASLIRIIYGGSVSPENAEHILKIADVDGCLPGGASLDPVKFAKIIRFVAHK
jgi:triosephosphate isomerase